MKKRTANTDQTMCKDFSCEIFGRAFVAQRPVSIGAFL